MKLTWAVRTLMACLVEGVVAPAAALSSSSGGGWRRDPFPLVVPSCLELEQAMQVNIVAERNEKGGNKVMKPRN